MSSESILIDRYVLENETKVQMFERVAKAYGDNEDHSSRILKYMKDCWFMPATPILSNGGTDRGYPISCFLNECEDSLEGITDTLSENIWLSAKGGGIGTYWGKVRSIGEPIRRVGRTCGIIPFIVMQDAQTSAISQGSLRRGASAVFLDVSHPEIEKFISMRKPSSGGASDARKCLTLHHGVVIGDDFMRAVEKGSNWELKSIVNNKVVKVISARELWIQILTTRISTGEPYIIFKDAVNKAIPESYKKLCLSVKTSNLCSEITLTTGLDHLGKKRTGVCCLSSVNVEFFDDWKSKDLFIEDIMRFLKNVLNDFIKKASKRIPNAAYSASRERSVGLGIMGFHSYCQKKFIALEDAHNINLSVISYIKSKADSTSKKLASELGSCPDAIDAGIEEYFTHKIAIAPTASISVIAGNTSPGIDPISTNIFVNKTLSGSFTVKNKFLEALLENYKKNTNEVWMSIAGNFGSVSHLDFLSSEEKNVFKTAFEIDQKKLIELAADRTKYVCQSQSLNMFLRSDSDKSYVHNLHFNAWKLGIKSLYYCRSIALQRLSNVVRF